MDILNLEWTSYLSRDRNMATMVCNYLRYMGLTVKESSVFCGFKMIDKLKPELLFITNDVSAPSPSTSTLAINAGRDGEAKQEYSKSSLRSLEWITNYSNSWGNNNVKVMLGYSYEYAVDGRASCRERV